jgi:predicted SprT family Zn-dependent metalloprotease
MNALELVRSTAVELEPSLADQWDSKLESGETVSVNGATTPVLRLPFPKLKPFFREIFNRADRLWFGGSLPECSLSWNSRFRSLGGRIQCQERKIELSSAHFESCGPAALGLVLIHEQIHLWLYERRRSHGHTAEFRGKSLSIGLPNIHHAMPLPGRITDRMVFHLYVCPNGHEHRSRRRKRRTVACLICCRLYNRGRFDERFAFRYVRTESTNQAKVNRDDAD